MAMLPFASVVPSGCAKPAHTRSTRTGVGGADLCSSTTLPVMRTGGVAAVSIDAGTAGRFPALPPACPKAGCSAIPAAAIHNALFTSLCMAICVFLDGSHYAIFFRMRSEEHTSELQSLRHLVCRLLLDKR